jgi:hypothetical protein
MLDKLVGQIGRIRRLDRDRQRILYCSDGRVRTDSDYEAFREDELYFSSREANDVMNLLCIWHR